VIRFCSPLFQWPIPWWPAACENWARLGPRWEHWVFTDVPVHLASQIPPNMRLVEMSSRDFERRVRERLGIEASLGPQPSRKFGDYRPFFGLIFAPEIGDADFWGHCDLDVVWGRLNHWFPPATLHEVDIFSTELTRGINGVCTLYRNTPRVNRLACALPDWASRLGDPAYHALDERDFSDLVCQTADRDPTLRFRCEPWHEYDRMSDHQPTPQLVRRKGGALCNARTGREMAYFHFKESKPSWPPVAEED